MGKSITLRALREREDAQVPPRLGVRTVAVFVVIQLLLLAILLLLYPAAAGAASVKGDVAISTKEGYARLVFTLAEETDAEVRLSNGIVIIAFKQAVDVSVDRIPLAAASYVGAARRDPDGSAVRLALNRKVTVNSMAAGEKLFVDLLPEGWTGLPPGLPQEVVEELAKRAREAEKKVRQRMATAQQRALPPVRVRVGAQPTFTRYTFSLPMLVPVSTERADDRMTLHVRGAAQVRSLRRTGRTAADGRVDRGAGRRRHHGGALRIHRQDGCPHVSRGQHLRHRRDADRAARRSRGRTGQIRPVRHRGRAERAPYLAGATSSAPAREDAGAPGRQSAGDSIRQARRSSGGHRRFQGAGAAHAAARTIRAARHHSGARACRT